MTLHRLVQIVRAKLGGVIDISDEYLNWLYFANAGMLHRGNLYSMDLALKNLPSNATVVEIGSFCGLSTNVITHFLARHGRSNRFVCCDPWRFEGATPGTTLGNSTVRHDEYRVLVRESFVRNVQLFSRDRLPHPVEMDSTAFFAAWAEGRIVVDVFGREVPLGGPLAFAFIDGDHTYDGARRDFEGCDRFLEPNGHLLFDDSADGSPFGVPRVVREVLAGGRYRLAARNPNIMVQKIRSAGPV